MCCMSRGDTLLKVGLDNCIFFQLRSEWIHNIVTVPLGVESLREKLVIETLKYRIFACFFTVIISCTETF